MAEAIGGGGTAALVQACFNEVFAFAWPHVAIGDQEVRFRI